MREISSFRAMAVRPSEQLLSLLVLLLLCTSAAGCRDAERQALLQFKRGLVDDYGILSSWGDEQDKRDCCHWRGVRCSNGSGSVVMLRLPASPSGIDDYGNYRSLRGEISPSLNELEHLTHLDLSNNDFLGKQIPPFLGSFRKMQYLNLSQTNFSGTIPTQLGNLSDLLSLDLSNNGGLQSEGLEWLLHLSSLRFLDLSWVNLTSAIHWPKVINQLVSLVHVKLVGCFLEFTSMSLIHPDFSPPLAFVHLSISNNPLGSAIFSWLLSFSTTLVHLHLAGDLNASIPDAFGNMTSIAYLSLSNCGLEGEIPSGLGAMGALEYLDISGNQLHGEIPSALGAMGALEYLDISGNKLHGEIPDTFGNFTSLAYLSLKECALGGEIPSALGAMGALEYLDISENMLHGEIPDTFRNMTSLKYLALFWNQLEGRIPDAIGDLALLTHLDLVNNQLTALPRALGVSLVHVDISSNSKVLFRRRS